MLVLNQNTQQYKIYNEFRSAYNAVRTSGVRLYIIMFNISIWIYCYNIFCWYKNPKSVKMIYFLLANTFFVCKVNNSIVSGFLFHWNYRQVVNEKQYIFPSFTRTTITIGISNASWYWIFCTSTWARVRI